MGDIYQITKPLKKVNQYSDDFKIKVIETITEEEYDSLSTLIKEAENAINEEITTFSKKTFTESSSEKEKMNFRIAMLFNSNNSLAGYGLGYCELDKLSDFYLDVIFVLPSCRGNSAGFSISTALIDEIVEQVNITKVVFNTQENNDKAIKLIARISKAYEEQ
jgi:hypothetical protein